MQNSRKIPTFAENNSDAMKYSELAKRLRQIGCFPLQKDRGGHPLWYSPKTGKTFQMSHHDKQEVATGTLRKIKRDAGLD